MKYRWVRQGGGVVAACCLLWGCAVVGMDKPKAAVPKVQEPRATAEDASAPQGPPDTGWSYRVVKEQELLEIRQKDRELSLLKCWDILGRLNIKGDLHISSDIKHGRPLKAPNDFSAYKNWTPLPTQIANGAGISKLVLIVKDIPFIGWYEKGRLVGDAQVCIGREWNWTEAGRHKVLEKDADHYSRSYRNEFGQPAWMPWGLRIYDVVWIHGGEVQGGYCSPGCVYLPLNKAEQLYHWADPGTPVLIVDALRDLDHALQ